MSVSVQREDFDAGRESARLLAGRADVARSMSSARVMFRMRARRSPKDKAHALRYTCVGER